LDKLEKADWFAEIGKPIDSPKVVLVENWQQAIDWCASAEWEDVTLEAANQYRERLFEKSMERFNLWNEIVAEIKTYVVPLVEKKTKKVAAENNLPEVFSHAVRWDILHLCMESEYADVHPTGFFESLGFWYVNGRFPCGWDGVFPEGKLVIF